MRKNACDDKLFRLANGYGVAGWRSRSESYFDRLEAAGKFPRRVSLRERREIEIDAYLDNLISKRSRALGTLGSQTD
ncbi:hypothetical protein CQ13_29695 [Bradyrhizobium retamae]|uniref:Uncharacterized protein n=1 Tax=Bradyrhizobium retamae TaxID=1300035 RepID=A0A0R3MQN7_9BRAD|nr:hypothetical protein CQ13_29695 [Bradyrhizobium retamae]